MKTSPLEHELSTKYAPCTIHAPDKSAAQECALEQHDPMAMTPTHLSMKKKMWCMLLLITQICCSPASAVANDFVKNLTSIQQSSLITGAAADMWPPQGGNMLENPLGYNQAHNQAQDLHINYAGVNRLSHLKEEATSQDHYADCRMQLAQLNKRLQDHPRPMCAGRSNMNESLHQHKVTTDALEDPPFQICTTDAGNATNAHGINFSQPPISRIGPAADATDVALTHLSVADAESATGPLCNKKKDRQLQS